MRKVLHDPRIVSFFRHQASSGDGEELRLLTIGFHVVIRIRPHRVYLAADHADLRVFLERLEHLLYPVFPGRAVAVGEQDVVGAGGGNGAIARGCSAKALVFLPDMAQRKFCACRMVHHNLARIVGRAVVGDQQFKTLIGLGKITFQHRGQCIGPVVGGDDYGCAHTVW